MIRDINYYLWEGSESSLEDFLLDEGWKLKFSILKREYYFIKKIKRTTYEAFLTHFPLIKLVIKVKGRKKDLINLNDSDLNSIIEYLESDSRIKIVYSEDYVVLRDNSKIKVFKISDFTDIILQRDE